jgi:methyl-accepting chemotaxis protein
LNFQIPVKSEDLNTNKEIAELINNIKFPDLSGTLNENKNDILSSLKEDIDIMKDDLQKSLHNVGRVNSMVLKSGNEQVAENVARIEKGFEQLKAIIKSIEVAPVVNIPDVKVDNTGVSEAINSIREDILNGLSELRKAVEKKKNYKVEFERDSSGFIKSPIKIVNE